MTFDVLSELVPLLDAHGRAGLATVVSASGSTPRGPAARLLLLPDGSTRGTVGGGKLEALVIDELGELLSKGGAPRCRDYSLAPTGEGSFGAVCGGKMTVFLEVVERPTRLVVVGAGHCGRALARAAAATGFAVTVVDDREEALDPSAFPAGVALVAVDPGYERLPLPGPADAIAFVSRSHDVDLAAARRLKGCRALYVGLIGSRARKAFVFQALRQDGFTEEELAALRSPIGLPIGAETPEEIALSILAELVAVKRGADPLATAPPEPERGPG